MAIKAYQKDGRTLYEVYLNAFDLNGKRFQVRRKGISSLRIAQSQEFELKCKLKKQKMNPVYNWKQWHELCLDRMKLEFSPSTVIGYDGQLKKWIGSDWENRNISTIAPSDIHEVVFKTEILTSENTRRTVLKKIRRIFQMAIDEGLIERNPTAGMKVRVGEPKQAILNATEVQILLQEAKATGHRFYEVWALALLTGMRSGEMYALKWTDIDFGNRRISLTRAWSCKSGFGHLKSRRNRVIPISSDLEKLLKEMKLRCDSESEFVLPRLIEWSNGEQAQVLRDFCKMIGITPIKFHDLRATFITQLLLKGAPLAQVMAIVGHSQLKTTNVYLRVIGSDLEGVTEKLSYSLPEESLAEVISLHQDKR